VFDRVSRYESTPRPVLVPMAIPAAAPALARA
jgi:hypothetical protein